MKKLLTVIIATSALASPSINASLFSQAQETTKALFSYLAQRPKMVAIGAGVAALAGLCCVVCYGKRYMTHTMPLESYKGAKIMFDYYDKNTVITNLLENPTEQAITDLSHHEMFASSRYPLLTLWHRVNNEYISLLNTQRKLDTAIFWAKDKNLLWTLDHDFSNRIARAEHCLEQINAHPSWNEQNAIAEQEYITHKSKQ